MNRILVLCPILPQWAEFQFIAKSLNFLGGTYKIDYMDPLCKLTEKINPEEFFNEWAEKIISLIDEYDIFFGFSFGGVILQQCLNIFEKNNKKLIIFSTPSFSDISLSKKLNEVINLARSETIINAINKLNHYVFQPYSPPNQQLTIVDDDLAAFRLKSGFQLILGIDSRPILQKSKIKYLHIIGNESQLVNMKNIIVPQFCQPLVVPNAGMRVLHDNLLYCIQPILQFLEENKK